MLINAKGFAQIREAEQAEEHRSIAQEVKKVIPAPASPAVIRGTEMDAAVDRELRSSVNAAMRQYIFKGELRDVLQGGTTSAGNGLNMVPQQFDADYIQALKASSASWFTRAQLQRQPRHEARYHRRHCKHEQPDVAC